MCEACSGVRILIVRDNDGADCRVLKKRLLSLVPVGAPEHRIRLVCQELESWFLGDLEAVASAYPTARRRALFARLGSRDPDDLTNASDLLH